MWRRTFLVGKLMRNWAFSSKVSSAKCFHATVVSTICAFIACYGANTWSSSPPARYTQTSVSYLGLKTIWLWQLFRRDVKEPEGNTYMKQRSADVACLHLIISPD